MKSYPMIMTLLRFKQAVAPVMALTALATGGYAAARTGVFDWLLLGAVLSVVLYAAAKSYVELIELVSEMLMPQ